MHTGMVSGQKKKVVKVVLFTRYERRGQALFPVLGSQPAGDRGHKPGGRLPVLSARLAINFPAAEHHRRTKLYCLVTNAGV